MEKSFIREPWPGSLAYEFACRNGGVGVEQGHSELGRPPWPSVLRTSNGRDDQK